MEDHTGEKFIGYYETNTETRANVSEVSGPVWKGLRFSLYFHTMV